MIGSDPWIKKRVNYLSCIEGKGGLKEIHCIAQNVALFVSLLLNLLLDKRPLDFPSIDMLISSFITIFPTSSSLFYELNIILGL